MHWTITLLPNFFFWQAVLVQYYFGGCKLPFKFQPKPLYGRFILLYLSFSPPKTAFVLLQQQSQCLFVAWERSSCWPFLALFQFHLTFLELSNLKLHIVPAETLLVSCMFSPSSLRPWATSGFFTLLPWATKPLKSFSFCIISNCWAPKLQNIFL